MATRHDRMRDRMRGAGRHNVGEVDFGFIIPVAEPVADEDAEATSPVETSPPAPTPVPAPPTRPTPNTSAKRRHLARDAPPAISPPPQPTPAPPAEEPAPAEDEDQPMEDAPPLTDQQPPPARQRGPLSSIISATKRLSLDRSSPPPPAPLAAQEEVGESPADAPGSGRPSAATPVVESSVLLQKVLDDLDDSTQQALPDNSSPIERRVATRRAARMSAESGGSARSAGAAGPGPARRTSPRFSRGSVAESHASREVSHSEVAEEVVQEDVVEVQEVQEVQHEEEEVEEEAGEEAGEAEGGAEDSTAAPDGDAEDGDEASVENEQEQEQEQEQDQEQEQEQEQARDGAEEAGEEETVQRLGRKRTRRTRPAPSPELSSGLVEESPPPKRRRRRESVSPAQQQRQQQPEQPAKKARVGRPPSKTQPQPQPRPSPPPQPQSQSRARPKPKAKRQTRKKRKAPVEDKADEEEESGSVPVTVQRFTKPPRAGDSADGGEEDPVAGVLNGEIPFANRGGVNAVDVLSKLCEELIETYMGKLEERLQAAEDPATKREQRTMYRALEAFQEELRTRLLEHTIALDTLHALRKRARAAQREKLALREEILRIRAEREQVALRMDAIRIKHEAESKEALRHISLSSAMHDIDLAVERGQAAPDLSPAEQKKAELANLELLISRVADQACTRSDGGGALKQIKEFNAFLERTAAVLEGR